MKRYPLGLLVFITVIIAFLLIGSSRMPHISYQPTGTLPQTQNQVNQPADENSYRTVFMKACVTTPSLSNYCSCNINYIATKQPLTYLGKLKRENYQQYQQLEYETRTACRAQLPNPQYLTVSQLS